MAKIHGILYVIISLSWLMDRIPDNPEFGLNTTENCAQSEVNKLLPKNQQEISPTACAVIFTDQPVSLICTFDNPIFNCAWTRRGFHVDINERYKYMGEDNGTNTKNCSVKIKKFKAIDAGQWMCKSMATSSAQANMGAVICLIHQVQIITQPSASTVGTVGKLVVLDCVFHSEQRCLWLHNGITISTSTQYNFNNSETKNCSLTIQQFQENDAGIWQCQNEGNETELRVTSTEAHVSIMEKPSPPIIFESVTNTEPKIEEMSIICISKHGNPPPNLYWVQGGTKQKSANRVVKYADSNVHDVMIWMRCSDITSKLECVAEHEPSNSKELITVGNLSCLMDKIKDCPSNCCEAETSGISGGLIACIVLIVLLVAALIASTIFIIVKMLVLKYRRVPDQVPAADENETL